MSDTTGIDRHVALHAASQWLVRLQDKDVTDAELEACARWIAASPVHATALYDLSTLWDAASVDSTVVAQARAHASNPAPPRHRQISPHSPRTGLDAPRAIDAASATAWRDGVVIYRQEPLVNVVDDFNRYSPVPAYLQDPALEQVKVTGRWMLAATDHWLEGLAAALDLQVTRTPHAIMLSRSDAQDTTSQRTQVQGSRDR